MRTTSIVLLALSTLIALVAMDQTALAGSTWQCGDRAPAGALGTFRCETYAHIGGGIYTSSVSAWIKGSSPISDGVGSFRATSLFGTFTCTAYGSLSNCSLPPVNAQGGWYLMTVTFSQTYCPSACDWGMSITVG